MKNYRIHQSYRIDIETVEKLMDMKAQEGTSINELVNKFIKAGIEAVAEQEIDSYVEKEREKIDDYIDTSKEVHNEQLQQETVYGKTQHDSSGESPEEPEPEAKEEGRKNTFCIGEAHGADQF